MVKIDYIDDEVPSFIRELMPDATEEKLQEATDNVKRYLNVALRTHERIEAEERKKRT